MCWAAGANWLRPMSSEGIPRPEQPSPQAAVCLCLHWLEGKVARSLGRLDEAASIFRQLLDELNARTLKHEIVLVTIDLADAMAEDRRFEEAAKPVKGLSRSSRPGAFTGGRSRPGSSCRTPWRCASWTASSSVSAPTIVVTGIEKRSSA